MANLSKVRRDRMIAKLEELKVQHNDDKSIAALNEIENALREKKYGLVFEEHNEEIDTLLSENIPILLEVSEKRVLRDKNLPWNFLIEGDNLQALYLLEKTHKGRADCIYIDPPYNTGSNKWKYNNDYVDGNDSYAHSKWLSMMRNRLIIAERILNPKTGVLIVTIDENEFHNLRSLIEEIFPNCFIQVVTIVINPKGVSQGKFSRVEEYAIYVFMPEAKICLWDDPMLGDYIPSKKVRWAGLLRSGSNAQREDRPNMYYPILIDEEKGIVVKAGTTMPIDFHPSYDEKIDGYTVVWPIRTDFTEGHWSLGYDTFNSLLEKGYVSLGKYDEKRKTWAISYLNAKVRKQIDNGEVIVTSVDEKTGVVNVEYSGAKNQEVRTVWNRALHNAGTYGTDFIKKVLGEGRMFPFPKSIYAEKDCIGLIVKDNPNAIVIDFFAGSGTTLNAVNLLNAEDNGQRTCILVTNNECSPEEELLLSQQGYKKGDDEWERNGICQSVTWPRIRNIILGRREDDSLIDGDYIMYSKKDAVLKRNFIKIDFIDLSSELSFDKKKRITSILLGKKQFPLKELHSDSNFALSEKCSSSILFNTAAIDDYIDALNEIDEVTDIYLIVSNDKEFAKYKKVLTDSLPDITIKEPVKRPIGEGFVANVKYLKCDWTPRKPDEYLLSNALCVSVKSLIELKTGYEVDGVRNVIIYNKGDFNYYYNPTHADLIENIWVNENIVFNSKELKFLRSKKFKYIPREFFSQELKEVGEYV